VPSDVPPPLGATCACSLSATSHQAQRGRPRNRAAAPQGVHVHPRSPRAHPSSSLCRGALLRLRVTTRPSSYPQPATRRRGRPRNRAAAPQGQGVHVLPRSSPVHTVHTLHRLLPAVAGCECLSTLCCRGALLRPHVNTRPIRNQPPGAEADPRIELLYRKVCTCTPVHTVHTLHRLFLAVAGRVNVYEGFSDPYSAPCTCTCYHTSYPQPATAHTLHHASRSVSTCILSFELFFGGG
jgi:hypothetical protein